MCRALRLHKDKTLATIIIENKIKKYSDILKNIVYIDKRLKGNKKKMFISIGFNKDEIIKNFDKVEYIIRGRNEVTWDKNYEACMKYERETGELIIGDFKYDNYNVSRWFGLQKGNYTGIAKRSRKLTPDELSKLMKLKSFVHWLTSDNWNFKWTLCNEYEILTGETITHGTIYKDVNLYNWVDRQRKNIKLMKGARPLKPHEMEKIMKLITVTGWVKNGGLMSTDEIWEYKFNLCVDYELTRNIAKATQHPDGTNIGGWIWTQRANWKETFLPRKNNKRRGRKLNQYEIDKIQELRCMNKWIKEKKI